GRDPLFGLAGGQDGPPARRAGLTADRGLAIRQLGCCQAVWRTRARPFSTWCLSAFLILMRCSGLLTINDQDTCATSVQTWQASCSAGLDARRGIPVADLGAPGRGRRIGAAAAAIGLAVMAAGCSGNPGHASGPEKTTIVVGAVPAVDTAGLYIAQQ